MSRYLAMSRMMRSNKGGLAISNPLLSGGTAVLIGLVSAAAAIIAMASVAFAQLASGDASFRGRVVEDFGGKIVIETDAGKFLVEPRGPTAGSLNVAPTETVVVTGVVQQRVIDASRIARENGEIVFLAPSTAAAPPARPAGGVPGGPVIGEWKSPEVTPAQIQAVLKAQGLTQVGAVERKKRHIEIPARDASGRDVIASLDLFGRIWEIEDADHDNKRARVQITTDAQAANVARQAGFGEPRSIERRKHHFEVLTTNSRGENLEVHVDLSGHIYKRVWVR